LPPEVLSRIIHLVPNENDTDTRSILALTHVCRCWREFIISTPEYWTSISTGSRDLATLSLQRAKGALLKVSIDMDHIEERKSWFSKIINPDIPNIKAMHISNIGSVQGPENAIPGFPQSTPRLRSLALGPPRFDWWLPNNGRSLEPGDIDLFESLAPALGRLELTFFPFYPSFLRLRALRTFVLRSYGLEIHLDTFLDFLEENRSLECATLDIGFKKDSHCHSKRRAPIANQLRHLSIAGEAARALISSIGLQRGAHLEILSRFGDWFRILPRIPMVAQFLNLRFLTFMECRLSLNRRIIRLSGPSGSFSCGDNNSSSPLAAISALPLSNVREFRLTHYRLNQGSEKFDPTLFPALETFAVSREMFASELLSAMFSNPSSPLRLKTLAFSNCDLRGDFMEELTQFASNRKESSSAQLRRVVIVDSKGNLPSVSSIEELEKHVPIVDVRLGRDLPADLT
jgi:hypothetical protein